jgi:hypothetical protein
MDRRGRESRLWRARESQRYDRSPTVVSDFCREGSNQLRPWIEAAAPYESAPLSYRCLENALLFVRSGLVMPTPFVAFHETRPKRLLESLPGSYHVGAHPPVLNLESVKPRQIVDGPVLSLCHAYGHGYGHWFADALPALLDLLDLVKARRLRILLPPLLPWQLRTLELLGVPDTAIVKIADATVGCADLVCHSYGGLEHCRRPGPLLREVYQRLRSVAPRDCGDSSPKLIYASRRGLGSWREFVNEAEIEAALSSAGFNVLLPESMTLDEQMAAFARAEVIVGPHGSALANAGFAPAGCLIVSILPEGMPHRWIYGLAHQLGHHLVILTASCQKDDGSDHIVMPENFFSPFQYRIGPEIVTERTFVAMTQLGVRPKP